MKKLFTGAFILVLFQACQMIKTPDRLSISSPSETIQLNFFLMDGVPTYLVNYGITQILDHSSMGFELLDAEPMSNHFEIIRWKETTFSEKWEKPWGENRMVKNHYNQLRVELQETTKTKRKLNIVFRIYDDGIGFRYEFPIQEGMSEIRILEEQTEFDFLDDHMCWWIPGDWDIYEHLYNTSRISEIDATSKRNNPNLAQTYIPYNAVNTPVTFKTNNGLYLSLHEANLTDYAGMTLAVDTTEIVFTSMLVGSERTPYKVKRDLPFSTPWRTLQISETAGGLIESDLIVNLNEPNQLDDISWFTPQKYAGIWWEMHLGKSSWSYEGGKHGATTENAKKLIDFAAANNIKGLLVEGWNTGWEHWIGFEDREGVFDFITPYPDYDLNEVVRYGKEKGVDLIMHHETSAAPRTYEQQLDTAFSLMQSLGIHVVKTGYVGKIIPKGEYHHGQWMVNHYRKVLETAAKYDIAVNAHEPIKATGIRRTLPNAISREGLRGQEFNAWAQDGGNPPEHLSIVAFTRMLAGPIDFTPGIFNIKLDHYKENNQVNTTLAHQLALYVVVYSPVQMVPDLTAYYQDNPAFQFIRDVGVDWEQTIVLDGEVGDFVIIAREERGTGNWFIGAITDENERSLNISLDFLPDNKTYTATHYRDGQDAHWDTNPQSIKIETMEVSSTKMLDLYLAPGGGTAWSLLKSGK